MTSDLASPMLATREKSSSESINFFPDFVSALNAEGDERALSGGEILFRAGVVRARLEAGIVDPIDAGMLFEVAGDGESILRMALEAEVERLNTLQEEECAVRRKRGAGVAQSLDARLEDEGERAECLGVGEAVVRRIGRGELLEAA